MKIGDRVIINYEDATIVDFDGNDTYTVKLDRHKDHTFKTDGSKLKPYVYRRYVPNGDNHMQLFDCPYSYDEGTRIGAGTWGVLDRNKNETIFWVTSISARMIVNEICDKMNSGNFLEVF